MSLTTFQDGPHQKEPSELPLRGLSLLDRFLVVWIILAMATGILLGRFVPSTTSALRKGELIGVSIPIGKSILASGLSNINADAILQAIGLLVMMYPILCKVRYERMHLLLRNRQLWIQIAVSLVLNWIVAPLFMIALAWSFLPDRQDLREGLMFVGIARCIAMVLIWNDLANGDGDYCAILVAFNSILQIVLYAPLAVFYIKIVSHSHSDVTVSYSKVATSVSVFLG